MGVDYGTQVYKQNRARRDNRRKDSSAAGSTAPGSATKGVSPQGEKRKIIVMAEVSN